MCIRDSTCTANPVTTDAGGYATFAGCSVNKAGAGYKLKAVNGATGATAYSNSFDVTAYNSWSQTGALNATCAAGSDQSFTLPVTATAGSLTIKGGGGGGGGGGSDSGTTGGAGGAGGLVTLTGFTLPRTANALTYAALNYRVGCGGGAGTYAGAPNGKTGGAGGAGWGTGGAGGSVLDGNGSRNSTGGGGGGGSVACLGSNAGTCGSGRPLVVAGGGGGGGAASTKAVGYGGAGGGGSAGSASSGAEAWYGTGETGSGTGGAGGVAGYRSGGGGAGGGTGSVGGNSRNNATRWVGGNGGGDNSAGSGGEGAQCTTQSWATCTAGGTVDVTAPGGSGSNGGKGGDATRPSGLWGAATGGGGGGGYYGGGGGGPDFGDDNGGAAAGGGGASSWANTTLGGTPAANGTAGGSAGTSGAVGGNGGAGGAGQVYLSLSGEAVQIADPGNQSTTVGSGVSLTVAAQAWLPGSFTCCGWSASGLPAGVSIDPSTGVISGTAPTSAQTVTVTVVAQTTSNSILAGGAQYSDSVTFTWTFTPAAAAKLAFTADPPPPPSTTAVGATFGATVQVQDTYGNLVPGATNTITVAIKAGTGAAGATLGGTVSGAATAGQRAFSNLTVDRSGLGYRLSATSPALTGADGAAFDVTVFVAHGATVPLGSGPTDPGPAASGVDTVAYYWCAGLSNSPTACTSADGTLIGTSATGPGYTVGWTAPATPGPYRVVAVVTDRVTNELDATDSIPVTVT